MTFKSFIKNDWLNRDDGYVLMNNIGISWGGGDMSKYIINLGKKKSISDVDDVILYMYINKIIAAMTNNRIKVIATTNNNNCRTDGKTIILGVKDVLEDFGVTGFYDAIDHAIANAVHETAHVLYSDFEVLRRRVQATPKNKKAAVKFIANILEDEYIERMVGSDYVGYIRYIKKGKEKWYSMNNSSAAKTDLEKFIYFIMYFVRYPSSMTKELFNMFNQMIDDVIGILTPFPTGTDACYSAAEKIFDLFLEESDEEQEDKQEDNNENGNGSGETSEDNGENGNSDDNSSNDDTANNETDGSSDSSKSDDEGLSDDNEENSDSGGSDDGTGSDNSGTGSDNEDGSEESSGAKYEYDPNKAGEVIDGLTDDTNVSMPEIVDEDIDVPDYVDELDSYEVVGRGNIEIDGGTFVKFDNDKIIPNNSLYNTVLSKVSRYVFPLRNTLKELNRNTTAIETELRDGDIDDDLLANMIAGQSNIYEKRTEIINRGGAVILLLDASGSVSFYGLEDTIREIAVLFERALSSLNNIEFYCYSHTTTQTIVSKKTTHVTALYENGGTISDSKAVAMYDSGDYMNNDGQAMLFCSERVEKLTELKHKIMFLVNDGDPSVSSTSLSPIDYTRKMSKYLSKHKNTTVIQIPVQSQVSSELMFDDWIEFSGYGQLIGRISAKLKEVITKVQMI